MESYSQQMTSDIVEVISQSTVGILNSHDIKYETMNDYLTNFLGLTIKELESAVGFIVAFLPTAIYLDKSKEVRMSVIKIFSKKFILFLVQEDKMSEFFQNNIKNFKDELIDEIVNDIYTVDEETI